MKIRKILALTLAILLLTPCLLCLTSCEKKYEEVSGKINEISKYGNILTTILKTEMSAKGYEFGDIVTIKFANKTIDIPYCSNYSDVDAGASGLFGKSDDLVLTLAINVGNFASTYGIAEKITNEDKSYEWKYCDGIDNNLTFKITMKEKRGYYDEYIVHQLSYTNKRNDYSHLNDEQYGNFRMVNTTGIRNNILYRASSPIDPSINRNTYVDTAAKNHNINVIVNLTDNATNILEYNEYSKSYYATTKHIELSMGMDYIENDFKAKLKEAFEFMANNEGVYLIHCKEGKDRTGFVISLLEFLMGASYEEAEADYMNTYYNYYGVTKGDEKYTSITSSNFENILKRAFGVNDVKNANLQQLTINYIKSTGLSDSNLSKLKINLSK